MGSIIGRQGGFGSFVNPFVGRTVDVSSLARVRSDTTMLGLGGRFRAVDWRPTTEAG